MPRRAREHIIIGPVRYTVVEVEELASAAHGGLCGDFDLTKSRIRINADMEPQAKKVTLWHEIIHGILTTGGYRDHDEQQIDCLAYGILQVLRDNPQLREG